MSKAAATVWVVALCAGCDKVVGPCVHEYKTPIVELTVKDELNTMIPEVDVDSIRINGQMIPATSVGDLKNASIVTLVSGTYIRCQVPCQFGHQQGLWEFSVNIPGRSRVHVKQNITYSSGSGGCPSSSSGPTQVLITFGGGSVRPKQLTIGY